ncbi:glycosyl transferase [Leptospira mtsangambouensis]|uniref:Glycosyl transferase n=1 Tax=Leptospira mtsangambouensis TaxID=2484912 RepID=A0ABY2P1Q1_9LEPT|nr:glycosyl transferase [Leptospira mtsangambouensis]TGM81354.1 glycosyl transferase [Leptospira mtsangambouensis]
MKLYFYISGHGFGHISRSGNIIKRLLEEEFIEEIHLVSTRISFLDFSHPKLKTRNLKLDVGVSQKNSLSIDLQTTKDELIDFEKKKTQLLKEETEYCKKNKIGLILTDSSSFPITIALETGIPSMFIGNFTWDFIYQNYAKDDSYFGVLSEQLQVEYGFVTEALVLPFSCPMPPFLESSNIGLVGRKPNLSKLQGRQKFGLKDDITYILLSFGAYGLEGTKLQTENLSKSIQLVAYGVPGIQSEGILVPSVSHYPDLVAAVDYVCTKPGYGILAECYYAKTPILYTDRGDFSEYIHLVNALDLYFRSAYIDLSRIISCQFEEVLTLINTIDSMTPKLELKTNGEEDVVSHLLEYN